ncbi:hypothetical protein B566_EDAN002257 [Ephemera danica]|nr:hypothetical protein B566_EDAN002257 [Ephemera danica]
MVMNYKRFAEEFGGSELALPRKNPRPEDYEQIFSGNTEDDFRIGITVTKKCLKLYADFYDSDLIIASPLGLRMIVGAEGEASRDYDFLASIEVLVADQADIFLQQNWDHLLHLWDHLHKQPKEAHGADFSRLRLWALAGHARYYRQTLLFSSVALPELNALVNRRCHNYAGLVRIANPITLGSICQVVVHMPQVFHRIEANSPTHAITSRFEMFTTKILPQFRESLMSHTMVFVSSYFDYVKVRNYFKREDTSFVQICEYSKEGKIARARDLFFHNEVHFMLYSERFHFFRRIRVKGIRHLIFYQPPSYPHFYSEMCNMMQEMYQNPREGGGTENNMSVTVLYCKYDAQRLAGILGSERASRMLESDRKVHMMVTGD